MRSFAKLLILLTLISFLGGICSCRSKRTEPETDMTITQQDIDLFILHKYRIDEITARYDKQLKKARGSEKKVVFEEGKKEIDSYLEAIGINPSIFMRKSKNILKCYLAFRETGKERAERKRQQLLEQEIPPEQVKEEMEFFAKAAERLFKSYTSELTEKEIGLIKKNLEKISTVVDKKSFGQN
jgi:hypothetical protein